MFLILGNECNKILKNMIFFRDVLPPHLLPFWDALYDFNNVLNSCFGFELDPDYNMYIQKLDRSIQILCEGFKFSVTNKIHIILRHLSEFIELEGKALGEFSEQVVESSHHSFEQIFERYKVKNTGCEEYGAKLLRSILDFNSNHI